MNAKCTMMTLLLTLDIIIISYLGGGGGYIRYFLDDIEAGVSLDI